MTGGRGSRRRAALVANDDKWEAPDTRQLRGSSTNLLSKQPERRGERQGAEGRESGEDWRRLTRRRSVTIPRRERDNLLFMVLQPVVRRHIAAHEGRLRQRSDGIYYGIVTFYNVSNFIYAVNHF